MTRRQNTLEIIGRTIDTSGARTPNQYKRLGAKVVCAMVGVPITIWAAYGLSQNLSSDEEQPGTPACEMSAETMRVSPVAGEGKFSVLDQISGVSADQCRTTAEDVVAELNRGRGVDLDAPRAGDEFIVPVFATFDISEDY